MLSNSQHLVILGNFGSTCPWEVAGLVTLANILEFTVYDVSFSDALPATRQNKSFKFENYEIHFILKRQIFRVYYKIILFLFNTAFYLKIVLSDLFCLLLKTN